MKNFQKGGGMGEVLKFVTLTGVSKKLKKSIVYFCKNDSILRPFLFKFRFERPLLSSAKRAQIKHKNHWRARAKLLDVLSNDIMRRPKNEVTTFLLFVTDYLQFAEQQALNLFWAVLLLQLQKDK